MPRLYAKLKSLFRSSKEISYNLDAGDYTIVVSSADNGKKKFSEYTLDVVSRTEDVAKDDNALMTTTAEVKVDGTPLGGWVGLTDSKDYYKLVVDNDGSYTIDLSGINGNAIKVSIGVKDKNGNFKSLQSITGAKGALTAELSRTLKAGTYYIKVESNGSNSSSQYAMNVICNNSRQNAAGQNTFSNKDNKWKDVAADVDADKYGVGDDIENWVGLVDTNDLFKIRLDENGQISFNWADDPSDNALKNKEISLSLVDSNGKSIALAFDKTDGSYDTKVMLMAGVDYFLNVKSNKPSKTSTEYKLGITSLLN